MPKDNFKNTEGFVNRPFTGIIQLVFLTITAFCTVLADETILIGTGLGVLFGELLYRVTSERIPIDISIQCR